MPVPEDKKGETITEVAAVPVREWIPSIEAFKDEGIVVLDCDEPMFTSDELREIADAIEEHESEPEFEVIGDRSGAVVKYNGAGDVILENMHSEIETDIETLLSVEATVDSTGAVKVVIDGLEYKVRDGPESIWRRGDSNVNLDVNYINDRLSEEGAI